MKDPAYAEAVSEEAVGGAHALAKLLQMPCDSVLLDRNLPDLDAAEVADEIRRQFPRIAVELVDSRTERTKTQERQSGETKGEPHVEDGAATPADEDMWTPDMLGPSGDPLPGMIGTSRAMEQVFRLVRMVASRDRRFW
jgi:CheY-like chemotaxis protein